MSPPSRKPQCLFSWCFSMGRSRSRSGQTQTLCTALVTWRSAWPAHLTPQALHTLPCCTLWWGNSGLCPGMQNIIWSHTLLIAHWICSGTPTTSSAQWKQIALSNKNCVGGRGRFPKLTFSRPAENYFEKDSWEQRDCRVLEFVLSTCFFNWRLRAQQGHMCVCSRCRDEDTGCCHDQTWIWA